GLVANRTEQGHVRRCGVGGVPGGPHSAEATGPSGRPRGGRGLPRLGRERVHYGTNAAHRWRDYDGVDSRAAAREVTETEKAEIQRRRARRGRRERDTINIYERAVVV